MTLEDRIEAMANTLDSIQSAVTRIMEILSMQGITGSRVEAFGVDNIPSGSTTLDISESLAPTMSALTKLQKSGITPTATQVAKVTRRTRNTESAYLTRLASSGYCARRRLGRRVIYSII